ncbi:MAG: S-layer homology domain-containing protein [Propionibacteriaceae bacterium]|nr:S-layer homology domain-containing protein [Propionibacteriaceae bacterium]
MDQVVAWRRQGLWSGFVGVGVAVVLVAGCVGLTMPSAEAAGVGVMYSQPFSGTVKALSPDHVYRATVADPVTYEVDVQAAPVSAGPTVGSWQTLYQGRVAWGASGGRVVVSDTDSGMTLVHDTGGWETAPLQCQPGYLTAVSGAWVWCTLASDFQSSEANYDSLWSLGGVTTSIATYVANGHSEGPGGDSVDGMLGSVFLVESVRGSWDGSDEASVQITSRVLTVRDAARGNAVVGQSFTPTPPVGAPAGWASLYRCWLTPGFVACGWAWSTSSGVQLAVSQTNWLTGKTTYVSWAAPSDLGEHVTVWGWDGVVVVANNPYTQVWAQRDVWYAFDLNDPSRYARLDGGGIMAVDGSRLALQSCPSSASSSCSTRIVQLPFGDGSAPYMIGAVARRGAVSPASPLMLDIDLTKSVSAGTVSIYDPAGKLVGSVKTPASVDGALRDIAWRPAAGAVAGRYTWVLNAKDTTGQLAVSNRGDGPASGSFTVTECTSYSDVPVGYVFATSICWLSANGVTKGTSPTKFTPTGVVSRGQMAAFLYRLAGSPAWTAPAVSPFVDVPTTNQFYKSITWLADQGITKGVTIGGKVYYQPGNAVNRGSMAAFLKRMAGSPAWTPAKQVFPDVASSHQFYAAIDWLSTQGVTAGTIVDGQRLYQPANPVTRGSMAALLQRLATKQLPCNTYPMSIGC